MFCMVGQAQPVTRLLGTHNKPDDKPCMLAVWFASAGAADGSLMFCMVGQAQPMTITEAALQQRISSLGFSLVMIVPCRCG
jgi:hypothetical protein